MSENTNTESMSLKSMIGRFAILLSAAAAVGFGGTFSGAMTALQSTACAVFIAIIFGTLFFWGFRLAIAFLGLAVLIFSQSLDIPTFVTSSSLEVIMFLVGMMVIVGALRDLGFFTWIVQLIVSMPNLNGKKFIFVTSAASALLACAVDEVTSIIFIATLIFQVCDRLKLNPTPYILIAVLATNIGSSGTMMGNPVGIFIGTKGQLTFGDFMVWAFPLMLVSLFSTIALLLWYFRKDLEQFDINLQARLDRGLSIAPVVKVPYVRGLILIVLTVLAIASHHQTEELLGLQKNSVLLVMPMICAGVVMILKPDRARHYIEKEVDWWTLIFFMLLFAVAGTLEHTHVDQVLAHGFSKIAGKTPETLVPFIFTVSGFGSAFVDNVIFVAAFSPVIEQLSVSVKDLPLWWALLFGACFGGNITMIGSTANIVALGMLEKHGGSQISFFQWFKIGLLCTALSGTIAVVALLVMAPYMPDHKITFEKLQANSDYQPASAEFDGELTGILKINGNKARLENKNAGIQVILPPDTQIPSGSRVRLNGVLSKDDTNTAYPYLMKVKKVEQLVIQD
jgi:Na+/H+ antiporter NhaD/arsenite permease-like protein